MRGIKLAQRLYKKKIKRETKAFLDSLSGVSRRRREAVVRELARLGAGRGPKLLFGATDWGQPVEVPLDRAVAHGLVLGASGAGKSYFMLGLISQELERLGAPRTAGFGTFEGKGELGERGLAHVYARLYRLPPGRREALKRNVEVVDFSDREYITPYNLLARRPGQSDEMLVAGRVQLLGEQFAGLSELSVRMKVVLRHLLTLMVECGLSLPFFERLCGDPPLLHRLAERSSNPQLRDYFRNRFDGESRATLFALRQRLDALLVSEGLRLSLSASTAPDFAALQDAGRYVFLKASGVDIARGVSEQLLAFALSDIKQDVFRRTRPEQQFVWFCDEAQILYKTASGREAMTELLTMARSFGSSFVLGTQSLSSAVRDPDILNSILTNSAWALTLRSTLRDAALIAPAVPVTGMLTKPQLNPFEPPKHLSESEEVKARLNEVTRFGDRQGYLWLRRELPEAVKITTPRLPAPHEIAGCSEAELAEFMRSERLGQGVPRREVLREIERQEARLRALVSGECGTPAQADANHPRRKGAKLTLVRALEDEYARK